MDTFNNNIVFSDSASIKTIITVNDGFSLSDSISGNKRTVITINDGFSLSDSDDSINKVLFNINDNIEFTDFANGLVNHKVVLNDGFVLRDYNIVYKDGIVDNEVDVYSVNIHNQAVSFYDNYYFNSVARTNGHYFGANENGIFNLSGNDDDGFDIRTRITSALLELTNGLKAKLEQIILYVRNDDTINVLIKTDDNIYDYVLTETSDNFTSKRVRFGKGMKSSYYTFELNTKSGKYTLDDVKLYYVVTSRMTR